MAFIRLFSSLARALSYGYTYSIDRVLGERVLGVPAQTASLANGFSWHRGRVVEIFDGRFDREREGITCCSTFERMFLVGQACTRTK